MKRVFQHPPEPETGRRYWRGLDDYAQTPEFNAWMEREFPAGAAVLAESDDDQGLSRRNFLRIMGASFALAGLGLSGCRRPEQHLVPFTKAPEFHLPGRFVPFATSMPRLQGALPLLVSTYAGRPIKIEGNPLGPNAGRTDAWAQASVLELYDPDRSKALLKQGQPVDIPEFNHALDNLRLEWDADGGASLAFIVNETQSPTRDRIRDEILRRYPQALWCVHEPAQSGFQRQAVETAFGPDVAVTPDYGAAAVVLSVDHDFLGIDESRISAKRAFIAGRRVQRAGDAMNRLYVVEQRFTLTGGMADHRLRLPARQCGVFLAQLAAALATQGVAGLANIGAAAGEAALTNVAPEWIRECAADLVAHAGRSLVLAGPNQPVAVQLLAFAINNALGNMDRTVQLTERPRVQTASYDEVWAKAQAGQLRTLVVIGANPAYSAPADLPLDKVADKIPNRIHLGLYLDETARLATWHMPQAHFLESWSDAVGEGGLYCSIQPMIYPLWNGVSDIEFLTKLAAIAPPDIPPAPVIPRGLQPPGVPDPEPMPGMLFVQDTFRERAGLEAAPAARFYEEWVRFLHDGFLAGTGARTVERAFNGADAAGYLDGANLGAAVPEPNKTDIEVVFPADYSVLDGRFINNAWLQEMPDPVSKLTWDNAALMSEATARSLGVKSVLREGVHWGDRIVIEFDDGRSLDIPVLIAPGHADQSITITLGYGRVATGRVGTRANRQGEPVGFSAYRLRTSKAPYIATGARIRRSDLPEHPLAVTQEHHAMEGRNLVREFPKSLYEKFVAANPRFLTEEVGDEAHAPTGPNLYQNNQPTLSDPHQWGMQIDLNTCIGCNACMLACQAENNIPVVGKEQVLKGREMHWIRVDRYFASETYSKDFMARLGTPEYPAAPEMVFQPLPCMHCENAPCETVCPVNATIHSEDGLNVMTYNRCIGTRYCANNCPYKVRRFNYFDYNQRPVFEESRNVGDVLFPAENQGLYDGPFAARTDVESIKLRQNPNVTVRMRGVIEKCTYCVQRIQSAKIDAKVGARDSDNWRIPADSFTSACAQACPVDAIVFGDIRNEASAVAKAKASDRDYGLLTYLGVRPRTTYAIKIRNPNPRMPGAELVAMSTVETMHHHGHGHGHGDGHGPGDDHGHGAEGDHGHDHDHHAPADAHAEKGH